MSYARSWRILSPRRLETRSKPAMPTSFAHWRFSKKQLEEQLAELDQKAMGVFRPQLDELPRKMQRQIDDVSSKVATLNIEFDSHTEQLRQLRAEIAELRDGLHMAKRQEAAPSPPASFDRQTDPAV
eukprot:2205522-Pyramimonas_sp.AAC.1